jgi:hypothetical protein
MMIMKSVKNTSTDLHINANANANPDPNTDTTKSLMKILKHERLYFARISTEISTRGCRWFPCLLRLKRCHACDQWRVDNGVINGIPLGRALSYRLTPYIASKH